MLIQHRKELEAVIEEAASTLDVPDHVYEDAILKYEDIAEHLADESSALTSLNPTIYPQGSFRLGTVIAPWNHNDDYDIDLVCLLDLEKTSTTQADLKKKVGDRLKERADIKASLEESRRCWRINYASHEGATGFHLDVLPAIPTDTATANGIFITDKDLHRWQYSNPIAYAEWFVQRMAVVYNKKRLLLAEARAGDIEDVPIWQVKTPLQRSVQILKRHRDIDFEGHPDDRPISIIITTLAAKAYQNEEEIYDALVNIVDRMHLFIENRDGKWWVANPVEPNENFADRWNEFPSRKECFDKWLLRVRRDFVAVAQSKSADEGRVVLSEKLGRNSRTSYGLVPSAPRSQLPVVPPIGETTHVLRADSVFTVREQPLIKASLRVESYLKGRRRKLWQVTDRAVPKNIELKFSLRTNASGAYTVRWQVANTGEEARAAGQLRGDFYDSEPSTRNTRWESTSYRGTHWVEAFVLDEFGVCVARTGRFYVKVR